MSPGADTPAAAGRPDAASGTPAQRSPLGMDGPRFWLSLPLVALAYAAAAVLGTALAAPPLVSSPLWPAAGVALAVLLAVGRGAWPALWVGYLLFHLFGHRSAGDLAAEFALGSMLATAASVQALLGATLARRHLSGLAQGRDGALARLLLLGGPVACVIAPTCGVLALATAGRLGPDAIAATWLVWWVGDSLGVLLCGPLAMLAFPTVRRWWRGRVVQIALPLAAVSVMLVYGMQWFYDAERTAARDILAAQAAHAGDAAGAMVQRAGDTVAATRRLFDASDRVTAGDFSRFAGPALDGVALSALAWVPRTPHDGAADPGQTAQALFVEAEPGTAARLVADLVREPAARAAMARARAGGRLAASAPVPLPGQTGSHVLLAASVDALPGDPRLPDAAALPGRPAGFVVGLVNVPALGMLLADASGGGKLSFTVTDASANGTPRPVLGEGNAAASGEPVLSGRSIDVHGRTWRIEARPAADHWFPGTSTQSRLFLFAALGSTFVIVLFVLSAAGRNRAIGELVAARTADLESSESRLSVVLDITGVATWEVDPESGLMSLDNSALSLLGTTAEREGDGGRPVRRWFREFVHPDDVDHVLATWEAFEAPDRDEPVGSFACRVVRRDGEVRYVWSKFARLQTKSGAVRILGSTQDVTGRRENELAVEDARRKLESAMDLSRLLSWEVDIEKGTTFVADRNFAFFGTTAEREGGHELPIEKWFDEFVHADDLPAVRALWASLRETGTVPEGEDPEIRFVRRDGSIVHVVMRMDLVRDENGRAVRLLGTSQDITARKAAELALQRNEAYTRSIIEAGTDSIQVLDPAGNVVDTFPGEDGFPTSRGVDGGDWLSLWRRDVDRDAARRALREACAGTIARFQAYTPSVDDGYRWWDVIVSPVREPDGGVPRLVAVTRDLTEEREAKAAVERMNADLEAEVARRTSALHESDRQHRAAFETAAVGMAHVAPEGRFLRVNAKLCAMTGYSEAELLQRDAASLTHPDDLERTLGFVSDIVRNGNPGRVLEKRYIRRDGSDLWVRITPTAVTDDSGAVEYLSSIIEDVTEAHHAELQRVATENRYRKLFARSPAPMWTYDKETLAITAVNQAAVAHYGYTRDEFLAMTIDDIRPPEDVPHLRGLIRGLSAGFAAPREVRHCRKDGTVISVEVTSHELPDEARPTRLVMSTDVTRRKRAERMLAGSKLALERVADDTPLEETLDLLLTMAEDEEPDMRCAVSVVNDDIAQRVQLVSPGLSAALSAAPASASLLASGGASATVAHRRLPVLVPDLFADPSCEAVQTVARACGLRSCWSVPILDAEGEVLGTFTAYWAETHAPTSDETELLNTLTRSAAIAISRASERDALEQSERRYRSTFERAPLGIGNVGPDGRFIRANRRLCEITGYDEAELMALGPFDITHPDEREEDDAQRNALLRGEVDSYSTEKRYVRKDGSPVWIRVTVSAVRAADGSLAYQVGIIEDISQRKQTEFELQKQQELNRLLLENLSEGVVACDAEGELMLFNRSAREWHGTDPMQIPKDEWPQHYDLYEGDGETPLTVDRIPLVRAFRGENVSSAEMCIRRQGGEPRSVLASGAPLLDAEGRKLGAVVAMHDVTERQQAERTAREALALLDGTDDAAFVIDAETRTFTYVNEGAVKQIGYTRDELLRMSPADITPDLGKSGIGRVFEAASRGDQDAHTLTTRHRRKDGSTLPVEVNLRYVAQNDARPRFIAMVRDVTERERALRELERTAGELAAANAQVERERASLAERVADRTAELTTANAALERAKNAAEAALKAKSAFLAVVSHEIRTPMNGVLGAMELLERLDLDEPQTELLGTAQSSARLLLKLLNDVLDMAKLEAGRIEVQHEPLAVGDLVESVVGTYRPQAEENGVRIETGLAPGVPEWVAGDALRVRQILLNLFSNALKFTDAGRVTLEVSSRPLDEPGMHRVQFRVRDTGTGIHPDVLASLFAPFEQGGVDAARRSGGTGLGLAICRGLAERMGGTVSLDSAVGHGTTATLELPFEQVDASLADTIAEQDDAKSVQAFIDSLASRKDEGGTPRVLAVDDNPTNRKVLVNQLTQLGLEVEAAADGEEALAMLGAAEYALVLTDCEMPRMDGFELVRRIRAGGSWPADLPVVGCTAHALPEVSRQCISAGMQHVLTKPVRLADLARALTAFGFGPAQAGPETGTPARSPRPGSTSPVLDRTLLAEMTGHMPDVEAEMIDTFREDTRRSLVDMRAALEARDYEQCRLLGHRNKGACLTLGAPRLAAAHACFEDAAAKGAELAELERAMDDVARESHRLDRALEEHAAALAA